MSSNAAHGEVYSINHYMIKLVSDLRQGRWFSPGTLVSSANKTDYHDITDIYVESGVKHHDPNPHPIDK